VPALEAEPLPTERSELTGKGSVGRDERRVGQQPPPMRRESDQVVAVGTIAVQQDDELLRRGPAGRRKAGSREVERSRHRAHSMPVTVAKGSFLTRPPPNRPSARSAQPLSIGGCR